MPRYRIAKVKAIKKPNAKKNHKQRNTKSLDCNELLQALTFIDTTTDRRKPTLERLPLEILECIGFQLTSIQDVIMLSSTCQILRQQLGASNSYFWYLWGPRHTRKFKSFVKDVDYKKQLLLMLKGKSAFICQMCFSSKDVKKVFDIRVCHTCMLENIVERRFLFELFEFSDYIGRNNYDLDDNTQEIIVDENPYVMVWLPTLRKVLQIFSHEFTQDERDGMDFIRNRGDIRAFSYAEIQRWREKMHSQVITSCLTQVRKTYGKAFHDLITVNTTKFRDLLEQNIKSSISKDGLFPPCYPSQTTAESSTWLTTSTNTLMQQLKRPSSHVHHYDASYRKSNVNKIFQELNKSMKTLVRAIHHNRLRESTARHVPGVCAVCNQIYLVNNDPTKYTFVDIPQYIKHVRLMHQTRYWTNQWTWKY